MNLPGIEPALLQTLRRQAHLSGAKRVALVGGAVRDALLHHVHRDPWRGLPDLDLVLEGSAEDFADGLLQALGPERVSDLRIHGCYGTVEVVLDQVLLDIAGARQEIYPSPGENPVVTQSCLENDLLRRDFTVNAMALLLPGETMAPQTTAEAELLDPHGGAEHLARRELAFLHAQSVADDPTRVIRAARYAARLDFVLAPEALEQVTSTVAAWPWPWMLSSPPAEAPPALATRLRMELELLFSREPWRKALTCLQSWGGMTLLDGGLQADHSWSRRLHWARRLGLPLLPAWVVGAEDPGALAERLQLPHRHQQWIRQAVGLRTWLQTTHEPQQLMAQPRWDAAAWTIALESGHWEPAAVVLVAVLEGSRGSRVWKPLLRWWGRWRHCRSERTAKQLLEEGWRPGPGLGEELKRLRRVALEQQR